MVQARKNNSDTIEPRFLLNAYANGFFPMADAKTGAIDWYSPDPRAIIELDQFRMSRSLRQRIRKGTFDVKIDTRFAAVMRECASREETWISEGLIQSYTSLFQLGFAHSVETWRAGKLVGGLYGVALGGAFFGESMFSLETDASKVALTALVRRLAEQGFTLLDTQFITPHLAHFGTIEISRGEYLRKLHDAVALSRSFTADTQRMDTSS